jgi:hypothetical protein
MTRDEVLTRLKVRRAEFDARVQAIPSDSLDAPIPGGLHSPKQIVAHVSAYEQLVVERLRAARLSEQTAFDRDRVGWEAFNARIWLEAEQLAADVVLTRSSRYFLSLLEEINTLADLELVELRGTAAGIDPAWLQGKNLAEGIGMDCFDHYPAHFAQLEAAAVPASVQA